MENVKTDYLNTVSNLLVTIGLFAATYILLNSREIRKEQHAEDSINAMLRLAYNDCLTQIDSLMDSELIMYIVKKVDFNACLDEPVVRNIKEAPFTYHELIMSYVDKGLLSGSRLHSYLHIRNDFYTFVETRITFYDHPEMVYAIKAKLESDIAVEVQSLSTTTSL